ncbi:hypothetical protein [Polaribacter sp. Z022]|uniref:hypothetical protein n=1 Tax=Polaribacter sp. Z022 TaxID=2927125 RepID=UPI002021A16D|nr:hypothetical protein [Polaribacter sp. Z022]MCL7753582.1 hypothetical protein [Polaribacter sp. Z022]
MIQYIKRKDLDIEKYNACIENSVQSRIYAFSWYLDIVADNWDVLVFGDYEAVMPIPWSKKYGVKYITQPFQCQQLGVFSLDNLSKETQRKFINKIPKKYLKVTLNFNSNNHFDDNMIENKNYILKLNEPFIHQFKTFSKGRKHAVKVGEKKELILKETSILSLIKIQEEFYNYSGFSKVKLEKLSEYVLNNKKGFVLGVFKDEVLLGGGFFLKSNNRITYLFSSFTNDGKKLQASSFLLNSIIKKYENSNFVLDFEGGNMPNIGSFYKSFGAEVETYFSFNRMFL